MFVCHKIVILSHGTRFPPFSESDGSMNNSFDARPMHSQPTSQSLARLPVQQRTPAHATCSLTPVGTIQERSAWGPSE